VKRHLLGTVQGFLRIAKPIAVDSQKTTYICLVGPTGVGKTTTLAKLASNFTLTETNKIAMVSIDTFRIGAIDQLKQYGQLLDIPVVRVADAEGMKETVQSMSSKELVLIDTTGYSQYNTKEIEGMKEILDQVPDMECHLTLALNTDPYEIKNIITSFAPLNPQKIIFTKMDETKRCGHILSALRHSHKEISYMTNGQRVPEDIEVPDGDTLARKIIGIGDGPYDRPSGNTEAVASTATAPFWT